MVNLHKHHPSTQGEAAQVLQDRLDHQGLASNQTRYCLTSLTKTRYGKMPGSRRPIRMR